MNETKDEAIEMGFQQLKNIRSQIYKHLADIDQLCSKSDQFTQEILKEYISEKERISANEMNDNDSLSPFKSKTGSIRASKEVPKVDCFPSRKLEANKGTNRKKDSEVTNSEVYIPELFLR